MAKQLVELRPAKRGVVAEHRPAAAMLIHHRELVDESHTFLTSEEINISAVASEVKGRLMSVFDRATNPASSCCSSACRA